MPIATGEHEYTKFGFKDLLSRAAADIAQPDVARGRRCHRVAQGRPPCEAFNIPVASHAYQLVHLHLACATPNMQVVEVLSTFEIADRAIFTEFPEPAGDNWAPDPKKLGLGLELDPVAVNTYGID